jgi:hypothetical protein
MVIPMYQLFGSGFGHSGSTSNLGAMTTALPLTVVVFSSELWPM